MPYFWGFVVGFFSGSPVFFVAGLVAGSGFPGAGFFGSALGGWDFFCAGFWVAGLAGVGAGFVAGFGGAGLAPDGKSLGPR